MQYDKVSNQCTWLRLNDKLLELGYEPLTRERFCEIFRALMACLPHVLSFNKTHGEPRIKVRVNDMIGRWKRASKKTIQKMIKRVKK